MMNNTNTALAADTVIFGIPVIDAMIMQLGGMRIFAMAFDWKGTMHNVDTLTLRIARPLVRGTKGSGTHVVIKLGADDVYTVTLMKYKRLDVYGTKVAEFEGVYADSLRSLVESMTGLALAL